MLFRCEVCKTFCTTEAALNKHFSSPGHTSRMKAESQTVSKSKAQASSSTKISSKTRAKEDGALSLKIVKVESIKEEDMSALKSDAEFTVSSTSPQKQIVEEEKDLDAAGEMLLKDEYILGADDDDNSFSFNESFPDDMIVIDDGFEGGAAETSQEETLSNFPVIEDDVKDDAVLPESIFAPELSVSELNQEINSSTLEKNDLNVEMERKRRLSQSPELEPAKKLKTSLDVTDGEEDVKADMTVPKDDVVETELPVPVTKDESVLVAATNDIEASEIEQSNTSQQSEEKEMESEEVDEDAILFSPKLANEKDHSEGDSEHTEELDDIAVDALLSGDVDDMMCDGEWEVKDEIDEDECVSCDGSGDVVQGEERKIHDDLATENKSTIVSAGSKSEPNEDASKNDSTIEPTTLSTSKENDTTPTSHVSPSVTSEESSAPQPKPDLTVNAVTENDSADEDEEDEESSSSNEVKPVIESDHTSENDIENAPVLVTSDDDDVVAPRKTNLALREMILKNVNACIGKYRNKINSNVKEKEKKSEKDELKPKPRSRKRRRLTDGDKESAAVYVSQVLEDVAKCLSSDGFYLDDSDGSQVDGDEVGKDISKDFSPIHSPEDHSFLLDDVSVEDFKMTDTVSETSLLDDVSDFSDISDLIEISDISDVDISDFETLVSEGSQNTNLGEKNSSITTTDVKQHDENFVLSEALKSTVQNANLKPLTVTLTRLNDESLSRWIRTPICDIAEHKKEKVKLEVSDKTRVDRIDVPQTIKKKSEEVNKRDGAHVEKSSSRSSDDRMCTSPKLHKSKMSELISKRATKKIRSSSSNITADFSRSVLPCAGIPNSDAASKLSNYRIPKKAVTKEQETSVRKSETKIETTKKIKEETSGSKRIQSSDSKEGRKLQSSHHDRKTKEGSDDRKSSSSRRNKEDIGRSSSINSDKTKSSTRDSHKPHSKDEKIKESQSRSRHSPSRVDRSRRSPPKVDRDRHKSSKERSKDRVPRDQDLRSSRSTELSNRIDKNRRNETAIQSSSRWKDSSSKRGESRSDTKKEQSPIDYFSDYWKVAQAKPEVVDNVNQYQDRDTRGYFWAHPSQPAQRPEQIELSKEVDRFQLREFQQRDVPEQSSLSRESLQSLQSRQASSMDSVEVERKRVDNWQSDVQRCVYKTDDGGFWGRDRNRGDVVEKQRFDDKYSDRREFPQEDNHRSPVRTSSESSWGETKRSVDDQVQRWIDEDFADPRDKERHSEKIQLDFSDPQEKERMRIAESEKSNSSKDAAAAQGSTTLQDLLACVLTIPTLEQIDKDTTETIKRNILSKLSDHLQELKTAKVSSVAVNLKPRPTASLPLNVPTEPIQYYPESRRVAPPTHYQQPEQFARKPDFNVEYPSNEKSLVDIQKEQIAQELAAVLTVTGRSQVSEDLLQRLVQQAISSKTTLSEQRASAVQQRAPEYASSSRMRASERLDWQYPSNSEGVVRNELYARRPVDDRPRIHDLQPSATITQEQYMPRDPNRLYTWPDNDVGLRPSENLSIGSRLGASSMNYDHSRIQQQQPENTTGSNIYYDRGSWQQGTAPYDVNRLYTNNPNQF